MHELTGRGGHHEAACIHTIQYIHTYIHIYIHSPKIPREGRGRGVGERRAESGGRRAESREWRAESGERRAERYNG
jgi:hypothetical protein